MSLRRLLNVTEAWIVEAYGLTREGVEGLHKVLAEPFLSKEEADKRQKAEQNKRSLDQLRRAIPSGGGFGGFGQKVGA